MPRRTASHSEAADWSRWAAAACLVALVLAVAACTKEPPRRTLFDELGLPRPEEPSLAARIGARLLAGAVATPVSAVCLWAGARLTKVPHATLYDFVLIAAAGQAVALIPYAGPILGMIVMCVLVCRRLEVDFLWDGALMVLVANAVAFWMSFVVRGMLER